MKSFNISPSDEPSSSGTFDDEPEITSYGGGWIKPQFSNISPINTDPMLTSDSSADTTPTHQHSTDSDTLQASPLNNVSSAVNHETPPLSSNINFSTESSDIELNDTNLDISNLFPTRSTYRTVERNHPASNIIGDSLTRTTRSQHENANICFFSCFLSQAEPKNIKEAL